MRCGVREGRGRAKVEKAVARPKTHLLHKHENLRCHQGPTIPRHREELRYRDAAGFEDRFGLEQHVHVEDVARSLDL